MRKVPLLMSFGTGMASRRENYTTGEDSSTDIYSQYWSGQTFTPFAAHHIDFVKLYLYSQGSPTTVNVEIRATSAGLPTGGAIASGSKAGSVVPATPGGWIKIILGAGANLSQGVMYAICVSCVGGASDKVLWHQDSTSPTYTGGTYLDSNNTGGSWTLNANWEFLFEEWGSAL